MFYMTSNGQSTLADTTLARPSLWQRLMGYISSDEQEASSSKLHAFSFIGGPHYDSETRLGMALVGTSQFRLNGCDTILQPSNATAIADVSTTGFFKFIVEGNIFFPDDARRLIVETEAEYSPTYFWGIGYDNGDNDENKTEMKKTSLSIRADYLWRIASGLYAGPLAKWQRIHTSELDRPELLNGERQTIYNQSFGFTVAFDTRDFVTAPSRGIYLSYTQLFSPKFLGNKYYCATTDLQLRYYRQFWESGIVATEAKALFNFGNPSWATMALLGDRSTMRGYYPARYRDKHLAAAQVELRQRLAGPLGMVLWGGAGTVFHDTNSFSHSWLPNYGFGLRWTFRPHVNIRLDYGFGKSRQNGFMFSINEAF